MEEKKVKKAEVKAMNEGTQKSEPKMTYEQLNDACAQLYQQNQVLAKKLQYADMTNMFRRLDYLFMVLKYENVFKDDVFVKSCADEIKEALTIQPSKSE